MAIAVTDRVSYIASRVAHVQTATLVKEVPSPSAFSYELKWDGYRMVAVKSGAEVRLLSRRGQDYTRELATIAAAVRSLKVPECAIDGEVCAVDARGVPSFQLLQNRGRNRAPLVFFVFDLLWLEGEDLRGLPIEERRKKLTKLIERGPS